MKKQEIKARKPQKRISETAWRRIITVLISSGHKYKQKVLSDVNFGVHGLGNPCSGPTELINLSCYLYLNIFDQAVSHDR